MTALIHDESNNEMGMQRSLARSVLYEVLSLGLRRPGPEMKRRLGDPQAARILLRAAREALDADALRSVRIIARKCRALPLPALAAQFEQLFGHTTRGRVSAYETEYGEDTLFQQPRQMSDIGGFLRAFGLQVDPELRERIDHASVECEFIAFLARKEAWALEHGDTEMLNSTCHAARLFLRDHLGRFAPALGRSLSREDAHGFYGALGDLLHRLVTCDCERHGVPVGPVFLPLRKASADQIPMACGGAHLIQIRNLACANDGPA